MICIYFLAIGHLLFLSQGMLQAKQTKVKNRVQRDFEAFDRSVQIMRKTFNRLPARPKQVAWVKKKLEHMVQVDQFLRRYIKTPQKNKYTPKEMKYFWRHLGTRWFKIDAEHTKELKRLLKFHKPWFVISKFGKDGSHNAWLLVQHADRNRAFQKNILKRLAKLYKKGECSAKNYAYLYDRVTAFADLRPQRYGTQGRCVAKDKWEPFPIENPKQVDARRKAVGIETLAKNKKRFLGNCLPPHKVKHTKAALQKTFYHLHQAVGHLESWMLMKALKKNRCLSGLKKARGFIKKAQKAIMMNLVHPFMGMTYYINGLLYRAQSSPVSAVEELRAHLHIQAQKMGLKQQHRWHQAFMACRKAKATSRPNQSSRP